jgi:N6-adenosine-specific RNA methylase IME4
MAYRDIRCVVCGGRFPSQRTTRLTCSDRCRQARFRKLRAVTPPLPKDKFDLLYVDPAWHFRTRSPRRTGRALPYDTMDLAAICRLPVGELAAPDSVLAILGARCWSRRNSQGHHCLGLYSTRKESESLWLAKRGNGLPRADKGVHQTIIARRRENSRKPDEAYVALERLSGDVRRIELFARRARPGWTRWGNELLAPDDEPMLPCSKTCGD